MRRTLAKLPCHPVLGRSAAFSSSSSGGGRGGLINIQFTANESHPGNPDDATESAPPPPPQGHGRGRGQPLPSPAFSNRPPIGRGPGFIDLQPPPFRNQHKPSSQIENEDGEDVEVKPGLPAGVANVWSGGGAGRGRIARTFVVDDDDDKPKIENRHVRQRPQPEARPPPPPKEDAVAVGKSSGPQLTREEKVRKAKQILSKGSRGGGGGGRTGGRSRKGEEEDPSDLEDDDDGDEAVRAMLANELGPELANTVMESFDEAFDNVVPDLEREEYIDALHTNYMLECEPEYIMEEFGTNPDIDDKPIIPLREAFEKQKPFLMTYLGIQDEEEWKEIIEETMKTVPLMKKVVDGYAGPDRITAMEQNKELESIVKTLPAGAPASVKHFAERALLSLQSNPGWGFDKKCLFMEKLVKDVSQQYQ